MNIIISFSLYDLYVLVLDTIDEIKSIVGDYLTHLFFYDFGHDKTELDRVITKLLQCLNRVDYENFSNMQGVAETAMLSNFLTIDYYHGSAWSVHKTLRIIEYLYPAYVKVIKKFKPL